MCNVFSSAVFWAVKHDFLLLYIRPNNKKMKITVWFCIAEAENVFVFNSDSGVMSFR